MKISQRKKVELRRIHNAMSKAMAGCLSVHCILDDTTRGVDIPCECKETLSNLGRQFKKSADSIK